MIDYELYAKIKNYSEQKGLKPAQIARELDLDPRTVANWLEQDHFRARTHVERPSKLDPFKNSIVRMLESHPYSAIQILQRICQEGFDGCYSIVKDYVRRVRPKPTAAFLKLAFAPGECAQVDWGSFGFVNVGSTLRKLSFFLMVLCYSRLMYLEFTVSQTMEHFLGCHQNAFDFFGGVPRKIMVDNLKSAVLRHLIGQGPIFNRTYLDFANTYGFTIAACNVRKGNEKDGWKTALAMSKKISSRGLTRPISMP